MLGNIDINSYFIEERFVQILDISMFFEKLKRASFSIYHIIFGQSMSQNNFVF